MTTRDLLLALARLSTGLLGQRLAFFVTEVLQLLDLRGREAGLCGGHIADKQDAEYKCGQDLHGFNEFSGLHWHRLGLP